MALFFAHITFQIRRGFRSRIFFELKILFLLFYDAKRRNQLSFWRHSPSPLFPLPGEEDSVFECHGRVGYFSSFKEVKGKINTSRALTVFSIIDTSQNQQISPNQNYI